jgi:hypothetical protein
VYSPVTFGRKYDPEGRFIRRFVPQLAAFPSKYIYEPWTAPKDVQQRCAQGVRAAWGVCVLTLLHLCRRSPRRLCCMPQQLHAAAARAAAAAARGAGSACVH